MKEQKIDMEKLNSIGIKHGAEQAMLLNGEFQFYIKKGDKASKHYLYMLKKTMRKNQQLAWEASNTTCIDRVVKFWNQIGKQAELITIDYSTAQNQE